MKKQDHYALTATWTGNKGSGTSKVSGYERSHTVTIANKPDLLLTTDNSLYSDKSKHNPEELLLAAISSCHLMTYLYLCALEGIVVMDYTDHATGTMKELAGGGGYFTEVILNPVFSVAESSMIDKALTLHEKAHEHCFIARSMNFPVVHKPVCKGQ